MGKYKRVLLKLSGEALAGSKKTGFDEETCIRVAKQVKELVDNGIQVLFYSYNFMKKKIEKDLNTARLYNHEYFIIGKKEIENMFTNFSESDNKLYSI